MTTIDCITALFYEVAEQLRPIPKDPEAHLQTWPQHPLPGCGNYWILLPGDTPNCAAFRLAICARFPMAPVSDFGAKQDPVISALA